MAAGERSWFLKISNWTVICIESAWTIQIPVKSRSFAERYYKMIWFNGNKWLCYWWWCMCRLADRSTDTSVLQIAVDARRAAEAAAKQLLCRHDACPSGYSVSSAAGSPWEELSSSRTARYNSWGRHIAAVNAVSCDRRTQSTLHHLTLTSVCCSADYTWLLWSICLCMIKLCSPALTIITVTSMLVRSLLCREGKSSAGDRKTNMVVTATLVKCSMKTNWPRQSCGDNRVQEQSGRCV